MGYAATGIADLYQEGATGNDKVIYPVQPIYNSEGRVLLAPADNHENPRYLEKLVLFLHFFPSAFYL